MSIGGNHGDQRFFEISVVRLSQSFEVFLAIKCFLLVFTYKFYINFIDEEQNCLWAVSEIDFVTERCALSVCMCVSF